MPSLQGTQTAMVVGPPGEEIFTDKYGRVKVQFHWDREGKNDADSSCWIRVGTSGPASSGARSTFPRIGQEVIVDFLEGDPDQPIIVGSVYNADRCRRTRCPTTRRRAASRAAARRAARRTTSTRSASRTRRAASRSSSTPRRTRTIEVENDETHWVGHDRTKTIDHDETVHVKHDRTETVDNNETITIHGKQTITDGQGQSAHDHRATSRIEIQMGNQTTKIDLGKIETRRCSRSS